MNGYIAAMRAVPARQRILLATLAVAVVIANVDQPYPAIAPLQHVPTVLVIAVAPLLLARFPLSTGAVASLTIFFLLHTLAGRYTYSNVPYDEWSRRIVGHDLSSWLGLARNDFDRVVHLSFGLLWVGPVAQMARRHARLGNTASVVMAFLFVCAASAAYEIFEWLLTIVLAPDMAADYNGQQGDPWDSQKDMAIAIVGAALSSVWLLLPRRDQRR